MPRLAIALALAAGALAARPALAAPPPLADYARPPAVKWMSLSPLGDRIAYFDLSGDQPRLVVRESSGPTLISADAGALAPAGVVWLDEDHVLAETSNTVNSKLFKTGKVALGQGVIVNVKSKKAIIVFNKSDVIFPAIDGYYGYSSENGTTYGYFGGVTLDQRYIIHDFADLYKVNIDTGEARLVAHGSKGRVTNWLVDAGAVVGHTEYDRKTADWRLYAGPDDKVLIAERKAPTGGGSIWGPGRTHGSVLILWWGELDEDSKALEYPLKAGSTDVSPFGDESVGEPIWDPVGRLLIGGVEGGSNSRTIFFDPALQTVFDKAVRALGGERVVFESATSNLGRMILKTWGPGDSGTHFLVDVSTHKIEPVAWDYPTILQDNVGPIRVVTYRAADGLAMQGVLTLPPDREPKRLPVVVLAHARDAYDAPIFDWEAQAFASRGYAVFQPNYRGSVGFGKAFQQAGQGQWGRKIQTDISDGLAELARQGVIDPKRACIMGTASGGYAALAGVTLQQGLYRCAVADSGISDLKYFFQWMEGKYSDDSPELRYFRLIFGVKSAKDPALETLSPDRLARRLAVPVLLMHSKDNTAIPISQSYTMRDALKAAGKPVEMIELPGNEPYFFSKAARTQMLAAAVAFVEKYNPPGADPECAGCAKP